MAQVNKSEQLFENFCALSNMKWSRVATASDEKAKRPDYKLIGHQGRPLLVEVKQFDPDVEEAQAIERECRGEVVVRSHFPGKRIREAIRDANRQLRALTQEQMPGLLVIYNNVWGGGKHTAPYAVLTAMRGLDVVPVLVPMDLHEPPVFHDMRPGPKKMLTRDMNTHVSAIAILKEFNENNLSLDVFHNPHPRLKIVPADIESPLVRHFRMSRDENGWDLIEPGLKHD